MRNYAGVWASNFRPVRPLVIKLKCINRFVRVLYKVKYLFSDLTVRSKTSFNSKNLLRSINLPVTTKG